MDQRIAKFRFDNTTFQNPHIYFQYRRVLIRIIVAYDANIQATYLVTDIRFNNVSMYVYTCNFDEDQEERLIASQEWALKVYDILRKADKAIMEIKIT